ncbi:hypothetical protein RHSIM_Rhsim03G0185300 [Rhododendron simsii]|uniref:Glycosyl transferase CAP10 domain-containing protein n=1 Tax=Rhododendron simsii TaxID=118357 RepID=A0A834H3P2_RHOSS|nr:hypothetical protein RHSIM_Rhsim03G0185300 [Rhododendron simsii]
MKSRPSGWQFLIYGSFFVVLLCIFHSINECISGNTSPNIILTTTTIHVHPSEIPQKPRRNVQFRLNCTSGYLTRICPAKYYPTNVLHSQDDRDCPLPAACPDYFRWIHEDLRPWKETGITRDTVESGRKTAHFRLVIVEGRAYVETYRRAGPNRDFYTLWGILQLLRRYPGKIPDLDLMFNWADTPVVKSVDYSGPNATAPPPLFRYCGDDATLEIVFPDWTFWGWPETNIKPWKEFLDDVKEGEKRWMDKEAYAYWKGNPMLAPTRRDLAKFQIGMENHGFLQYSSEEHLIYSRNYKTGLTLADNLSVEYEWELSWYKIYVERVGWSVSEKYILACNSVTLPVKPRYYDFFTSGLMPMHHYWPINEDDKCRSIKFAVEWGNSHKQKAQEIGKAGSDFTQEDLVDYVYDYMFHLLSKYAKLMRYKPTIPERAIEICSETLACPAIEIQKKIMMESMVKDPTDVSPCDMSPPYDALALRRLLKRKANSISQVELWEMRYWENQTKYN